MAYKVDTVAVVGAGTMGAGIAEVCAKAWIQTTLIDVSEAQLQTANTRIEASLAKAVEKKKITEEERAAALSRLEFKQSLEAAKDVDLLIEAVPENMALKLKIFAEAQAVAPKALIASNTSSLSLTELAAGTKDPARVVGLHFFNPPAIMPLLEIVTPEQCSTETLEAARAFAAQISKEPIVVNDSPGFATSRLGIILGMEAIRMLEAGVASAEDIDRAMTLGYKHPMGPLKLTDLVGLDVRLAIAEHLSKELGAQFFPPPLLRRMVRAGKLGKKTGEGFYKW